MVWTRVEVVGDADEVIRVLGRATVRVPDGERIPAMGQDRWETKPVSEPSAAEISPAPLSGGWTKELAADFMASLDAVARRMALYVWGRPVQRASTDVHFANGPSWRQRG